MYKLLEMSILPSAVGGCRENDVRWRVRPDVEPNCYNVVTRGRFLLSLYTRVII